MKNKKNKKKILIILLCIFSFLLISAFGCYKYYEYTISGNKKTDEKIEFYVDEGSTTKAVIDKLYEANIIKNKYTAYIFVKLNPNYIPKAGLYEINRNMSLETILDKFTNGKPIENQIVARFIEGKRLTRYVKDISAVFPYTEEEILNKLEDEEFIKKCIEKYWFLTEDVLNDKLYYSLEGYLYADTYYFKEDSTLEEVIFRFLDGMDNVLKPYKKEIENSKYSVHEILTLASIIELEGTNTQSRKDVAGVFYNRLESGWSLGSDVTTYYAAKVEMSERDLYIYEINDVNDYNTRPAAMAGKLPIGPICSPSKTSIEAAINPNKHDYYFFVADKNNETYFTKTNEEHNAIINQLKKEGKWFEY